MRLLIVTFHPEASAACDRHYPFWQKAGCDRIIGVTSRSDKSRWPTPDFIEIGPYGYISDSRLPLRLIQTLEHAISLGADEICITEWDCIFFKPLPVVIPPGFTMNTTGGGGKNYRATRFFHPPWFFDRASAITAVEIGRQLLSEGIYELGSPDIFIGLITDLAFLPINEGVFTSYSRNAFDLPCHLAEARAAYRSGVTAIHGLKSEKELAYILAP